MSALTIIGNAARWTVRKLLRVYYRRIEVEGRGLLPHEGAVLFVANHPNSLIDPALIGYAVQRPVHFFAKATLFDVPVFGALMHALGTVPAYRGADDKSQVKKNLESLEAGAVYLRRGEPVGIFPEGKTHDREGVEQVRSGAARIAAAAVQGGGELKIVPLGLNYERKERFRSSIWVRVGEPIDAGKLFREHAAEERKAMRLLTDEIDAQLKAVVIHLEEERWQVALFDLEVLLPPDRQELTDAIAVLRQRKRTAEAMNYLRAHEPAQAEALATALEQHRARLASLGVSVDSPVVQLAGAPLTGRLLLDGLRLVPGLVPALAGALHHVLPFLVTRAIVNRIKHPGRATIAMNRLLIGLPIYGLWYAFVWWLLARHAQVWIAWLWTGVMPVAGVMALHYAWRVRTTGRAWWSDLRLFTKRARLHVVRREQKELIEKLREMRARYRAAQR